MENKMKYKISSNKFFKLGGFKCEVQQADDNNRQH
jgi:hypothetical protein